jgi:hypothetical protein
MQLPRFTAEIALRQKRSQVHAGSALNRQVGTTVVAQRRVIGGGGPVGQCFSTCFLNGGSPLQCFFRCGPGQLNTGQFSTFGRLA